MVAATGIGSGLDIEALVTQLVAAEGAPTSNRLASKEAELTAELSSYGSYKGALSSFQSSLSQLTNLSTFGQRQASSSDDSIATISAGSDAKTGSYDLGVTQLAKAHSLSTGSYDSASDVVGTGTITIRFGSTDYTSPDPGPEAYNGFTVNPDEGVATLTIDSSNNTLEGLRNAINDADIGVSAVIANDGSGYRLLLNSSSSGENNSLEISVDDTGDANDLDNAGLSSLAFNSNATNLEQTVAAQDAIFSINGLSITSSENTVKSVIDGVDITLKDLTGEGTVNLSVSEDKSSVEKAITNFINAYNSFVGTSNRLTAYDSDSGEAGTLQGDFTARSVNSQLRQVLGSVVQGFGQTGFSSLSEIGITTQADGTLAVDSADLNEALDNNFDEIVGMFAAVGFSSDDGVDFISSTDETSVASYAINISQIATQGQLVGASTSFPLDIDDDNDSLTIKVDGVTSNSISLTQGSYASGADLAAELQARINGDEKLAASDVKVSVAFNGDHFEITSERYGAASKVELTAVDTNLAAELGLSVATGTDGLDVAGTIGGVAATGAGQFLTGAVGSSSEGLKLQISGGLTGDRGSLDFSRGIAYQLNEMVSAFLDSDGLLDTRTEGIQEQIDDLEDQNERLNLRLESLEARYRAQFNALDSLIAQLNSTSNFLTQQLDSLPQAGSLVNRN